MADNKTFAQKNGYKFPLLSDSDKKLATALGNLNPQWGMSNRWTYVVDDKGIIRYVDTEVTPEDYGKTLVAQLKKLKVPRKK